MSDLKLAQMFNQRTVLSIFFGAFMALAQTPVGIITTVAGNGTYAFSGDGGAATNASLSSPRSVAISGDGSIVFSDRNNFRIRKIAPNGTITTVAGNGRQDFSGDRGAATSAVLNPPRVANDAGPAVTLGDERFRTQ